MVWLQYAVCLLIILAAGTKLARYGDIISEKTGLGRLWIGVILIAAVTSAPELVTGVSAVTLVDQPDLAVGNILGSCTFNLLILVILDLISPIPVLRRVSSRHIYAAWLGLLLISLSGAGIIISKWVGSFGFGWVGLPSLIIFLIYLVGMRWVFSREGGVESVSLERKPDELPFVWPRFFFVTIMIIGAGVWLAFIGDEIAREYNLSVSFIGSLLVAISTSTPEIVVAVAATRMGATDLAVAELLGSNLFNIAILFVFDLFYLRGPILADVSPVHLISSITATLMSAVVIIAFRFTGGRKVLLTLSWYSLVLALLYFTGAYILFTSAQRVG